MLLVNRYLLNRLCFVLSVRVTVFHTALLAALFGRPVRSLFAYFLRVLFSEGLLSRVERFLERWSSGDWTEERRLEADHA